MTDFRDLFPQRIIDMIGEENFKKARLVDWQQKWLGNTDYIDSTRPNDFSSEESIFYGVDCYKRPFIFLKVKCLSESDERFMMINIFQRYSDTDRLYVACSRDGEANVVLEGGCAIGNELLSNISNFLKNGYATREATEYESQCRLEITV